jgi:hypothetical protein
MSMTFNSRFDVGEVSDFYAGDVSRAGGKVSQASDIPCHHSLANQRSGFGSHGWDLRQLRLDHDGYRHLGVLLDRDQGPHQADHLIGEQRIKSTIVDAERRPIHHFGVLESGPVELVQEAFFGQRAGNAARPGRRLGGDFGR